MASGNNRCVHVCVSHGTRDQGARCGSASSIDSFLCAEKESLLECKQDLPKPMADGFLISLFATG